MTLTDVLTDNPPTDAEMLDAYLASARRIVDLARNASDSQAERQVPACPAWSVRNLVAHVTSIAVLATTGADFGDDPQKVVDREIEARQGHSLQEIADEWEETLPKLEQTFRGQPVTPMVVDVVTHEHDIRAALGPEFADHTAGLREGLAALITWIQNLELIGEDGIELATPTGEIRFGGGEISTRVKVNDDWELLRILGVRRSRDQLEAYDRTGPIDPLLTLTSRYPLPTSPLEVEN